MSTLETSAKYLSEKGLTVKVVSSDRLFVHRDGDRVMDLSKVDAGYEVSSWEYVPGPGEEDFRLIVPALEEALLIAWCYYFAKNIEVSGWELPIHRRPYWGLPKLQYRIANSPCITAARLESIRQERWQRALANPAEKGNGLAFAEHTQFIVAGTHAQSKSRLFLRRDMEEGYIVADT